MSFPEPITRSWQEREEDLRHSDEEAEAERYFREEVCPECEHPWSMHGDKYGCEYEPGDVSDPDIGWRALPPCGCKLQKEQTK